MDRRPAPPKSVPWPVSLSGSDPTSLNTDRQRAVLSGAAHGPCTCAPCASDRRSPVHDLLIERMGTESNLLCSKFKRWIFS